MTVAEENKPGESALKVFIRRVLTPLLFYLLFVPLAFLLRILGKDPLHKKPDPMLTTYRVTRRRVSKKIDGKTAREN